MQGRRAPHGRGRKRESFQSPTFSAVEQREVSFYDMLGGLWGFKCEVKFLPCRIV